MMAEGGSSVECLIAGAVTVGDVRVDQSGRSDHSAIVNDLRIGKPRNSR